MAGTDARKRILFYSEGWGLGGIERFIMNVAPRLDRERFAYEVFSVHDWSEAWDERIASSGGIRHCVFPGEKPSLLLRYRTGPQRWRALLSSRKFDVVHVNIMNGAGFIYAKIAEECAVPTVVVHSHNTDFGAGSRALKGAVHRLGKRIFGRGDYVRLACSSEAGRYLFDGAPFEVIPNPVDVREFAFSSDERVRIRASWDADDDALVFGSVGRLTPEKNALFLVDVLQSLIRRGRSAKLALIGSGPSESEVRSRAESLKVAEHLLMMGAQADPAPYYSALDVFVMPSIFEGLGITRLEARAAGLPCVLSKAVPLDAFKDSRTFVMEEFDPDAWAETLLRVSGESGVRTRAEGGETILDWGCDADSVARRMMGIYDTSLAGAAE